MSLLSWFVHARTSVRAADGAPLPIAQIIVVDMDSVHGVPEGSELVCDRDSGLPARFASFPAGSTRQLCIAFRRARTRPVTRLVFVPADGPADRADPLSCGSSAGHGSVLFCWNGRPFLLAVERSASASPLLNIFASADKVLDDGVVWANSFCGRTGYSLYADPRPPAARHCLGSVDVVSKYPHDRPTSGFDLLCSVLGHASVAAPGCFFTSLTLTDSSGSFRYLLALVFHQRSAQDTLQPNIVCIESVLAQSDRLKICLLRLVELVRTDMRVPIERVLLNLFEIPLFSRGISQIDLSIGPSVVSFHSHTRCGLPAPRYPAHVLFEFLSLRNATLLFLLALLEHRVVMHSENISLLNPLLCVLSDLQCPLRWVCTFVPVLPDNLLEIAQAPTPFVLGMHSATFEKIEKRVLFENEIIVVGLDQNSVGTHPELPPIPSLGSLESSLLSLTSKMRASMQYDIGGHAKTHAGQDNARNVDIADIDTDIQSCFFDFIARVLGPFQKYVRYPQIDQRSKGTIDLSFDADGYLAKADRKYRPFYARLFKTQSFAKFLQERTLSQSTVYPLFDQQTAKHKLGSSAPVSGEHTGSTESIEGGVGCLSIKDTRRVVVPRVFETRAEGASCTYFYKAFPELDPRNFYPPRLETSLTALDRSSSPTEHEGSDLGAQTGYGHMEHRAREMKTTVFLSYLHLLCAFVSECDPSDKYGSFFRMILSKAKACNAASISLFEVILRCCAKNGQAEAAQAVSALLRDDDMDASPQVFGAMIELSYAATAGKQARGGFFTDYSDFSSFRLAVECQCGCGHAVDEVQVLSHYIEHGAFPQLRHCSEAAEPQLVLSGLESEHRVPLVSPADMFAEINLQQNLSKISLMHKAQLEAQCPVLFWNMVYWFGMFELPLFLPRTRRERAEQTDSTALLSQHFRAGEQVVHMSALNGLMLGYPRRRPVFGAMLLEFFRSLDTRGAKGRAAISEAVESLQLNGCTDRRSLRHLWMHLARQACLGLVDLEMDSLQRLLCEFQGVLAGRGLPTGIASECDLLVMNEFPHLGVSVGRPL